jgi:hypothetical protein
MSKIKKSSQEIQKLMFSKLSKLNSHIGRYITRAVNVEDALGKRGSKLLFDCFENENINEIKTNLIKLNKYVCQYVTRSYKVSDSLGNYGCNILD